MNEDTDSKAVQKISRAYRTEMQNSSPTCTDQDLRCERITLDLSKFRELSKTFGGYALLPGEKKEDHISIQNLVFTAMQPSDYIELMLTVDIADAEIDLQRCKKLRVKYLEGKRRLDLIARIAEVSAPDPTGQVSKMKAAERFVTEMMADPGGEAKLCEKLQSAGQDPAIVMANAAYAAHEGIDLFDRLIEQAMKKRDTLIRQLQVSRDIGRSRTRSPEVIDLESEEVKTRPRG